MPPLPPLSPFAAFGIIGALGLLILLLFTCLVKAVREIFSLNRELHATKEVLAGIQRTNRSLQQQAPRPTPAAPGITVRTVKAKPKPKKPPKVKLSVWERLKKPEV